MKHNSGSGYGYGMYINSITGQIWHDGHVNGYVSYFSYYPRVNKMIFILSNSYLVGKYNKLKKVMNEKLPRYRIFRD